MLKLGYTLSSEEHGPRELVRYAQAAEAAGFSFALISDHYHPWIDRQGNSPFVWGTLGAISQVTDRIVLGTAVTCPIMRMHPAVIAQAAATAASLLQGRFFLGVGSGENLNEHIVGQHWPSADVRIEMLEEAVVIIRDLWKGRMYSRHGRYFKVENARIYSLPASPPPIMVAASGAQAAKLAGRIGDGLIGTAPNPELIHAFGTAGGAGKPRYGQLTVCWGEDEASARRTAHEYWPNTAIEGDATSELPLPAHFEQLARNVREEDVARRVPCGPDLERHVRAIEKFGEAGYDHVFVHQIGPNQEGFFEFYRREVMPRLELEDFAEAYPTVRA